MSERGMRQWVPVAVCRLLGHRRFQKVRLNGRDVIVKAAGGCLRCGQKFDEETSTQAVRPTVLRGQR